MVKKENPKSSGKKATNKGSKNTTKSKVTKTKNIKEIKKSNDEVKMIKSKEAIKIDAKVASNQAEINASSKKYSKFDLLKWIGGLFLILVVLTWVIKSGQFASGEFSQADYEPLGLLDLIRLPISTIVNYSNYGILILAIGGMYGVMNSTGAYSTLVEKVASKFANKKKVFLSLTVTTFGLLSAITGLQWVLIILVPLFVAILRKLNYSCMSSFMATVGAILVGNLACIYGFNVCGYLNYYIGLELNQDIFTKVILFIMLIVLLTLYISKHDKHEVIAEDVKESMVKTDQKRSVWPLAIILCITVLFLLVSGYNWYYGTGYNGFTEIYENMANNYNWLNNVIGQYSPLGYWGPTEFIMVLLVASMLIAWLYSLGLKNTLNSFVEGCKLALRPAFYVVLASIIIYAILGTSTGNNVYFTISNAILGLSENVHALVMSLFTFVSGLFLNDFSYFVGYMSSPLINSYTNVEMHSYMALIMQTIYGFVMMFVPTSMLLVGGLSYLKINYKDYIKYVWLLLLEILIVCLILFVAIAMFM